MSGKRFHTPLRSRRAFSITDLLWLLFLLALAISILLPSLSRARELAKRAVCASNLRGIAQGALIYANDNVECFPQHYFEATPDGLAARPTHGVDWVGSMGSQAGLKISQQTSKSVSPKRSHPSRSLFLLIISGSVGPNLFICPSTADLADNLRNYGPDAGDKRDDAAGLPGVSRFDFPGYDRLSYGYQLPFGPLAQPRAALDARMVIAADKGPYYQRGPAGLAGTKTVTDSRSPRNPPDEWASLSAKELRDKGPGAWRTYNSPNHDGEGQNVVFVDGHVDFGKTPLLGLNHDNVFTVQSAQTETGRMIGLAIDAGQTIGALTNTDSVVVP
ncbi:MAG: hypothetical protein U1D55_16610 [Phycisphaerae bacterium]